MSKFEELREANKDCRTDFCRYERECHSFGKHFVQGFCDYINCPKDSLNFFPLKGADINKKYNLAGASDFDENGFFHFGISIRLTTEGHYPQDSMSLKIFFKKIDDNYKFKFAENDTEINIKSGNESELIELYETIFQKSKDLLRNRFNWWLRQQDSKNPIGFSTITQNKGKHK